MINSKQSGEHLLEWLNSSAPPWIGLLQGSAAELRDTWLKTSGNRWFEVDGRTFINEAQMYEQISVNFGFPSYFGHNLNALYDCLTDEAVLTGERFVIHLLNANLAYGGKYWDVVSHLLSVFILAAENWATEVREGQPWDRSSKPFHIIISNMNEEFMIQNKLVYRHCFSA